VFKRTIKDDKENTVSIFPFILVITRIQLKS